MPQLKSDEQPVSFEKAQDDERGPSVWFSLRFCERGIVPSLRSFNLFLKPEVARYPHHVQFGVSRTGSPVSCHNRKHQVQSFR